MAAEKADDFVLINPESKEDEAEAPKSSIANNLDIDDNNLMKAQKEYINPEEQKYDIESNKYEMHPFGKKIMDGKDDSVLCMIRRDKAPNPVVYRAKYKDNNKDNGFDINKPIENFWLKIAQGSIKYHRESGKIDDRVEVSYIESTLAYGIKCQLIDNKKQQQYYVKFNALPTFKCILKQCPKHLKPKLFGNIDGKECYLKDIHVSMKKNWFGVPTVDYITLKGFTCDNDTYLEHKINA